MRCLLTTINDKCMAMRSILILFLSIFTFITLTAQSNVGLGIQVGCYKARDADGVRGVGGVALRFKLSDLFRIEGSINYREEAYVNGFVNVKSWPVLVTGLFYPSPILYGAMGAGWYNTSIDYNIPSGFLGGPAVIATEKKQEFGWHFGGGADLPLGSAARLVGDIRYVFLNYDFKNFPGSNGVNSNFYIITVTVLFEL
jgi:hypothetical protein